MVSQPTTSDLTSRLGENTNNVPSNPSSVLRVESYNYAQIKVYMSQNPHLFQMKRSNSSFDNLVQYDTTSSLPSPTDTWTSGDSDDTIDLDTPINSPIYSVGKCIPPGEPEIMRFGGVGLEGLEGVEGGFLDVEEEKMPAGEGEVKGEVKDIMQHEHEHDFASEMGEVGSNRDDTSSEGTNDDNHTFTTEAIATALASVSEEQDATPFWKSPDLSIGIKAPYTSPVPPGTPLMSFPSAVQIGDQEKVVEKEEEKEKEKEGAQSAGGLLVDALMRRLENLQLLMLGVKDEA